MEENNENLDPQKEIQDPTPVNENTAPAESEFAPRIELDPVAIKIDELKAEIRKMVVGQSKMIELLISAILANGHVLIEGNPGLAKTLTSKVLASAIDSGFSRIQFTPDLMPSDVLGTSIYNIQKSSFEFKKGPIFSNIILIDEINRAPAKTQAALFEVMEEKQITMDGQRYKMSNPFMIVATQNPIDMEGTYRLPEAQMDRFLYKISVGYPDKNQELKVLEYHHSKTNKKELKKINKVLSADDISAFKAKCKAVTVEAKLMNYIVDIVQMTRTYRDILLGASPRASIGILSGAKSLAVIRGRDFVTPDDIRYVAGPVLNHRVTLTPEKEMEGVSPERVIDEMIQTLEVPR